MTDDTTARSFQVDLRGVVDLLSRHIYSGPRVYLRELLQNARDAITARREIDGAGGTVRITPISDASDEFVLTDDGVGLTVDEVADLLATVGRSSKRDIFDLPRSDYLGQFGIGLLSCFMVSDTIVIRSRSARGGSAVQWTGHSDGTFTVAEIDDDLPFGTSVHLRPRFDQGDLLRTAAVTSLAEDFARYLPIRIRIDLPGGGEASIAEDPPFLASPDAPAAIALGTEVIGAAPFEIIPIAAPGTGTAGHAYVLPFAPPPTAKQATRVYLGRMLLAERVDDLLPDWAFFVRAVVDSTGLNPTASRESLVDDDALEHTREALGAALRRWVLDLGLTRPHRLAHFVSIHDFALKSIVLHDAELASFIVPWLTVDTTLGRMRIGELVERFDRIRYAETIDEYRQVAGIIDQRTPLVNGGYLYDAELVGMLPGMFEHVRVERVDVVGELDRLDPPPLDDRAAAIALEARASLVLAALDCAAVVRSIDEPQLPALYVADPAVLRTLERRRLRGGIGGVWGGVLDRAAAAIERPGGDESDDAAPDTSARLCLNWSNRVVRRLTELADPDFEHTVHLLYVQALLAGQRPLREADRAVMTTALTHLVDRAVGEPEHPDSDPTTRPEGTE
jgi:molecular chaperone HtpG